MPHSDTYSDGRHEHGQNHLHDRAVIDAIVAEVSASSGPIVEVGPGRGALTFPLAHLGRPLTAVDIDRRAVTWLRERVDADLVAADFLTWPLPDHEHVIVGNLPFHQTTAVLRRILHAPRCTHAVVLVQWEVARRRAGVGGATMMTAQWWPWVEFRLVSRVPADAFRPRPTVDGGILVIERRAVPLVDERNRAAYRQFVHAVFTGRGRGIEQILARSTGRSRRSVTAALAALGIAPLRLPRDLTARQWAALFARVHQ